MALSFKHTFGQIDGTRVSFVESNLTQKRMEFLKSLLELNGFTVLVQTDAAKDESAQVSFTLGVTDLLFNAVIWIYDRRLKTLDGRILTHEYWEQATDSSKPQYWEQNLKS
jgi:hypothetical protein